MPKLEDLDRTLRVAAMLLDSAASQVRDARLQPTRVHIRSIGEALAAVFEVQQAIYKIHPDLSPKYEEPPEEVRQANRRLGEAMLAADSFMEAGKHAEAKDILARFAADDPSEYHRGLALLQLRRYEESNGA